MVKIVALGPFPQADGNCSCRILGIRVYLEFSSRYQIHSLNQWFEHRRGIKGSSVLSSRHLKSKLAWVSMQLTLCSAFMQQVLSAMEVLPDLLRDKMREVKEE